jgi:HEXXH motif-containing protein
VSSFLLASGYEPWSFALAGAFSKRRPVNTQQLSSRLARVDFPLSASLAARGLHTIAPDEAPWAAGQLDDASNLLDIAPTLKTTVLNFVQEIVLLQAPDDTIDVSHSEPRWARRIFISVPSPSVVADLRIAEAVVHEAMHLNLSWVDRAIPLIANDSLVHSPWRNAFRPASGVLHGLYVFCCIWHFHDRVRSLVSLAPQRMGHVEARLINIAAEVLSIDRGELARSLTAAGQELIKSLLNTWTKSLHRIQTSDPPILG